MNNKYYNIIGISLFFIVVFILLIIFYFELENSNKIVDTVVNNSHVFIPQEKKNVISENAKDNIKKVRNLLNNYPSLIKDKTNNLILKSLPENVNIPIQECPTQEINQVLSENPFDKLPEIALPEDMPWDEQIHYCKNKKGNIYDIDMYDTLFDYQPKMILH